jgi:hypothetical protein
MLNQVMAGYNTYVYICLVILGYKSCILLVPYSSLSLQSYLDCDVKMLRKNRNTFSFNFKMHVNGKRSKHFETRIDVGVVTANLRSIQICSDFSVERK